MVRFDQIMAAETPTLKGRYARLDLSEEAAMKRLLPLALTISITLMACSVVTSFFTPGEPQADNPDPSPIPSVQPSPTQDLAGKTMHEPMRCPVPEESPPLPDSVPFSDLQNEIQRALNSGLHAQDLATWLHANDFVQDATSVVQADFDGDRFIDIAVSIQDPEAEFAQLPGRLLVYLCSEDRYESTLSTSIHPGMSAPFFLSTDDLTNDGAGDLVFGKQNCGAHTCTILLQALVWRGDRLENRLEGRSDDLPYPMLETFPQTGEIIATGSSFGSVGAGPYQPLKRSWQWMPESETFVIVDEHLVASDYRIHVLHDADRMVADGKDQVALDAYARVISADELQDWIDPVIERANLSVFAAFRQLQVALRIGDMDLASERHQTLMAGTDDLLPGSGYRRLAEIYWTEFQQDGEAAACSAVRDYAQAHEEDVLTPLYFGYGNPQYGPEEMCLPALNPANP